MNPTIDTLVAALRRMLADTVRHRQLVLAAVASAAALGVAVLPFVRDRYQASARVFVDTQTALKPLLEGLTYQEDVDRQVRTLARTLISRPNAERIAQDAGIAGGARDQAVRQLLKQLQLMPTGAENVFEIRYRDPDARRAQAVVQATLALFVSEGVLGKQRDAQGARSFIDEQIADTEVKLQASEERLKDFKKRQFGLTGVSSHDYFSRISLLSEEVARLRADLDAAVQARNAYRRELEQDLPDPALDPRNAPTLLVELQARLDAQHKLVDELRLRYTEAHPDLANARRALAELESEMKRRKDEVSARMRTPSGRRTVQSGNPLFQKLRSSLAEAEAQVAGLQAQLRTKQAALEEARAAVGRMPQVEAELSQLNRDYEVVRRKYEALVGRREAAALGAKLDQGSRLAEFRIIEPSRVSDSPVFPSRTHLAWMAVALTLVTGLLTGTAMRALKPTVDSALALAKVCGRPVIGAVSMQLDPLQERAEHLRLRATLCAVAGLLLLQAGWAAWMTWRAGAPGAMP